MSPKCVNCWFYRVVKNVSKNNFFYMSDHVSICTLNCNLIDHKDQTYDEDK